MIPGLDEVRAVLSSWSELDVDPAPFGSGLINLTLRGTAAGGPVIVQRLHPVFAGTVHHDIDAVTRHLAHRGVVTPRLVPTRDGRLWVDDPAGRPVRVLTFVEGTSSFDRMTSPALAAEAGRLVARFHAAVADLTHDYAHVRAGVHDTPAHLARLEAALDAHRTHRLAADVGPLARGLLATRDTLLDPATLAPRHAHGDLKLSNLLFDDAGRGVCLVDLDTLGRLPLAHELGDAFRSWCNPTGEERGAPSFDADTFEAALGGYASAVGDARPSSDERAQLVLGAATIARELAARFLTDALEERYFGWDAARYPGRGEHQLARARTQLALSDDVLARRGELEAIVQKAF